MDIDEMIRKLHDPDPMERMKATLALHRVRDHRGTEALLSALEDEDPHVRMTAAHGLTRRMKGNDTARVALLDHLRDDPDARVRQTCCTSLLDDRDPRVTEALIEALDDPYFYVKSAACFILGANQDARAIARLWDWLDDASGEVRLLACTWLITLRLADDRVVHTVEELRQEPEAHAYEADLDNLEKDARKQAAARTTL